MTSAKTQWEKIVLKVLTFLLPVVFVLPFYVSKNYFFPFIVTRNLVFRAIVGVALAFYAMLFVARPKAYFFNKNFIIYSLLGFVGILTLSSFINGDIQYSFWSNYERMDGLLNLYFVTIFIFLLIGVFQQKKDWLS